MYMRSNRGFTLLELLVVIAIIGVLAGIILVAVYPALNKSKTVRATEEMNELAKAFYYAKFNSGLTLTEMTGSNWSEGGCSTGIPATTLPSPDLRGNNSPGCY